MVSAHSQRLLRLVASAFPAMPVLRRVLLILSAKLLWQRRWQRLQLLRLHHQRTALMLQQQRRPRLPMPPSLLALLVLVLGALLAAAPSRQLPPPPAARLWACARVDLPLSLRLLAHPSPPLQAAEEAALRQRLQRLHLKLQRLPVPQPPQPIRCIRQAGLGLGQAVQFRVDEAASRAWRAEPVEPAKSVVLPQAQLPVLLVLWIMLIRAVAVASARAWLPADEMARLPPVHLLPVAVAWLHLLAVLLLLAAAAVVVVTPRISMLACRLWMQRAMW